MSTVKEIAKQTGYSISTVSIVLRGQGDARSISKKTQAKIIKAAKDTCIKAFNSRSSVDFV